MSPRLRFCQKQGYGPEKAPFLQKQSFGPSGLSLKREGSESRVQSGGLCFAFHDARPPLADRTSPGLLCGPSTAREEEQEEEEEERGAGSDAESAAA